MTFDIKKPVLLLGLFLAAAYTATEWLSVPFPAVAIWKASGIVLFGLFALMSGARLAAAGLFFSAAGDVALALPVANFVAGMAFFGTAHLLYTVAFYNIFRDQGMDGKWLPGVGLVILASIGLLLWFLPDMAELTIPGLGYQAIITLMVLFALLSRGPLIVKLGAFLFMLSDTLIAFGLYKNIAVIPGAVWVTYAAAQLLIAKGFVKARQLER